MLTTSEERVELLRKGYAQKQIEKMYIEGNNFKMVNCPVIIEMVELNCSEMANIRYISQFMSFIESA